MISDSSPPGASRNGSEGEFGDHMEDPLVQCSLWDDSSCDFSRDDRLGDPWDQSPVRPRQLRSHAQA